MTDIAQYLFLEFIQFPSFFDNGFLIAAIFWFCGCWCAGAIIGFIFN